MLSLGDSQTQHDPDDSQLSELQSGRERKEKVKDIIREDSRDEQLLSWGTQFCHIRVVTDQQRATPVWSVWGHPANTFKEVTDKELTTPQSSNLGGGAGEREHSCTPG